MISDRRMFEKLDIHIELFQTIKYLLFRMSCDPDLSIGLSGACSIAVNALDEVLFQLHHCKLNLIDPKFPAEQTCLAGSVSGSDGSSK